MKNNLVLPGIQTLVYNFRKRDRLIVHDWAVAKDILVMNEYRRLFMVKVFEWTIDFGHSRYTQYDHVIY